MTGPEVTAAMARNIVSQLGDLYMEFTHPATTDRGDFVRHRQATNDQADTFVEALLRDYGAGVLEAEADEVERYARETFWRDDSPFHLSERSSAKRHAERLRERATHLRATTTEEPTHG